MPERGRPLLLALAFLTLATGAPAQTWRVDGEALRRLHADTLEDVLRAAPMLTVERQGGEGLPYRVLAPGARPGELLLVVDGVPWRDAWTGEPLAEELPIALVEAVELDLRPQLADYGDAALAGVIRVTTRRPEAPRVQTRLQLSRGSFGQRGRHLTFTTPPGDVAVLVGLDEVFAEGYPFSAVWNGEPVQTSATPEISLTRRRQLSTRVLLDGGGAGPLELSFEGSAWHLDRSGTRFDPWYRERTRFALQLPSSPLGALTLSHTQLDRHSADGRATDAGVALRWSRPLAGDGLRLLGGAERHQLGFTVDGERTPLPRPAWLWLGARGEAALGERLRAALGGRFTAPYERRGRVQGEASLRWTLPAGWAVEGFAAGGRGDVAWGRDRVPDLQRWPAALSAPGEAPAGDPLLRTGAALDRQGESFWARLLVAHEEGGLDWVLVETDAGGAWRAAPGEARQALGATLGTRVKGLGGVMAAAVDLSAEGGFDEASTAERAFYPLAARGTLSLGRAFFAADARLTLDGGLEFRGGRSDHGNIVRASLGAELRVLDARFWLRLSNALDWAGEELPGFPVQPSTLRLGIDWQLDH